MKAFLSSKRWEVILAALIPLILPVADAFQSGVFHGKTVEEAVLLAAVILLRAAASHRQSPPADGTK